MAESANSDPFKVEPFSLDTFNYGLTPEQAVDYPGISLGVPVVGETTPLTACQAIEALSTDATRIAGEAVRAILILNRSAKISAALTSSSSSTLQSQLGTLNAVAKQVTTMAELIASSCGNLLDDPTNLTDSVTKLSQQIADSVGVLNGLLSHTKQLKMAEELADSLLTEAFTAINNFWRPVNNIMACLASVCQGSDELVGAYGDLQKLTELSAATSGTRLLKVSN